MNFCDPMAEPGFTATSRLSFRFTDLRRASTSKAMAGVPRKRKTGRGFVFGSVRFSDYSVCFSSLCVPFCFLSCFILFRCGDDGSNLEMPR